MIGFLWWCKQAHRCTAAKCSEVWIFCKCCFNVINRNVWSSVAAEGEQDCGMFLAQLRSGAAPPCSLTTAVMSDTITAMDLLPKLPLTAENAGFSGTHTFLSISHSRQVHGLNRALTYAPSARARFYIYMRTVNMPLDSRAFQLRGFTSFQSLSCSFSKNGKALPSWGKNKTKQKKTKNVICHGSVGRHLGLLCVTKTLTDSFY